MSDNTNDLWTPGNELQVNDDCPKDCDLTVHELNHERNPQIGTERHDEAPETEMVCRHHGIVEAR